MPGKEVPPEQLMLQSSLRSGVGWSRVMGSRTDVARGTRESGTGRERDERFSLPKTVDSHNGLLVKMA
jgi:hypothetical protein